MEKSQDNPGDGTGSSAPKPAEEKARTPSPPSPPVHPVEAEASKKPELEDPSEQDEHGAGDALMESFNG